MSGHRKTYLTASQLVLLDAACLPIYDALGHRPYLVGSVTERSDWRDVDVRSILPDDEFDALFAGRETLWSLLCLSVSEYLSRVTRLPVDYQIQRMTEANEKFGDFAAHPRNALAMHGLYAGGGDAKPHMGSGIIDP